MSSVRYQNPNFDKDAYWRNKQLAPQDKRTRKLAERLALIVGYHTTTDWPAKPVSKKALRKNTKRARKVAT